MGIGITTAVFGLFNSVLSAQEAPEKVVDLRSGFSRMVQRNGKQEWSGFDGQAWVASNGMVNTVAKGTRVPFVPASDVVAITPS